MAIIYLRASTNEIDLFKQREKVEKLLATKEILFKEFVYIQEISSNFENSRFYHEILHGNYPNEIIYVLSIDRICRDIDIIESIFPLLSMQNIQIFCLQQNKYFTQNDIVIRKLFKECSNMEKEHFSNVTKESLADLKNKGITLGKPRKYDFQEYFEIISNSIDQNMTYREIGKMLNIDASTAYRIYSKGIKEGAYRTNKKAELKELIKKEFELKTSFDEITKKYNITYQFLTKLSREIKNDELILKVEKLPLDLKQKIASEVNASVEILAIAKKHNLDPEIVRTIFQNMKGGANW